MSIDKSINEIFFRLKEHKEIFIKLVAIGEFGLVFTAYGVVSDIDRNNIYFSYKRMYKGKNCLSEDSKNPNHEQYTKREFNYEITFLEDFTNEDFSSLIDLTLQEVFPYSVYNAFKSYLSKPQINNALQS